MLPGVHRVSRTLAGGMLGEYWYAWRGGPQILKAVAASDSALRREIARLLPDAVKTYEAEAGAPKADGRFLAGLVTAFLDERIKLNAAGQLADRTLADDRRALDVVRLELGRMEVRALEDKRARQVLVAWRDKWAHQPKTADKHLGALAAVTAWAKARGDLERDPLVDWPRLYKVDRAHIIFEDHEMALLLDCSNPAFGLVAQFAALTTLREADCARIPKNAIGTDAIIWQTGKSRGRKTVVVPIYPELRTFLDTLPKHDATTILASSTGHPWTVGGIGTAMQRAKQRAALTATKTGWRPPADAPERRSPIDHLRFHDLRGTGATKLMRAGMPLEDLRFLTGWAKERLESIALRYVTAETIALGIIRRMKRNAG